MVFIGIIVGMPILFYLLGKAADVVITSVKNIGEMLRIKIFLLGILLGFLTSLPEVGIGINATIDGVSTISVGNLLGGIVVLFSLVLGINVVLHRGLKMTEKTLTLSLVFAYFLLPLALALDGFLSFIDGILLVITYFLLLTYLYYQHKEDHSHRTAFINKKKLAKDFLLMFVGVTAILLISDLVVHLAELLLSHWSIRPFIVGLLMFSLGTNLPEIIVAVKSWSKNLKDLSLSNLIGSGLANGLILGGLVIARPVNIVTGSNYYFLIFSMGVLFLSILYMFQTGKELTFKEGLVLASIYFLFLFTQLSIIFNEIT